MIIFFIRKRNKTFKKKSKYRNKINYVYYIYAHTQTNILECFFDDSLTQSISNQIKDDESGLNKSKFVLLVHILKYTTLYITYNNVVLTIKFILIIYCPFTDKLLNKRELYVLYLYVYNTHFIRYSFNNIKYNMSICICYIFRVWFNVVDFYIILYSVYLV